MPRKSLTPSVHHRLQLFSALLSSSTAVANLIYLEGQPACGPPVGHRWSSTCNFLVVVLFPIASLAENTQTRYKFHSVVLSVRTVAAAVKAMSVLCL
jgi:hypothetical protein